MEGFRESAVYMTELAMTPHSPSLRHSRYTPLRRRPATRDSTCTYSTLSSTPRSRNISIEPLYRLPRRESFTAPGSVSPSSASRIASSDTSFTRGRSLSRRPSSNSSSWTSQSSVSCEPTPKPPSPSQWLSNSSRQTPEEQSHSRDSDSERSISPPGSSTFRSGVARPVRVHRFSMPGSVHSRSDSSLSFDTVRTIDTTSPTTSPTLIGIEPSPMVYSCEFAKAIKMVRVCVPAGSPSAPRMAFNGVRDGADITQGDSSSSHGLGLSLRTISSCASLTISSDNSTDTDADEPVTPDHLELLVHGISQGSAKVQQQSQQSTPPTTRSLPPGSLAHDENLLTPVQLSADACQIASQPQNHSMSLPSSGATTAAVARPATALPALNEVECRGETADDDNRTNSSLSIMSEQSSSNPQYDQQPKRRWRWMSKAKTRSRYFIGLLADSN